MAMSLESERSSQRLMSSLRTKWVMLQKRNRIHVAESRALIVLTMRAT